MLEANVSLRHIAYLVSDNGSLTVYRKDNLEQGSGKEDIKSQRPRPNFTVQCLLNVTIPSNETICTLITILEKGNGHLLFMFQTKTSVN